MSDGDKVEFGNSGLVNLPEGGYYNKYTKEHITEDGKVFVNGDLVYDPDSESKDEDESNE